MLQLIRTYSMIGTTLEQMIFKSRVGDLNFIWVTMPDHAETSVDQL